MKHAQRTTINVPLRIAPAAIAKLRHDAQISGFKTTRAYLEALIEAGLPEDAIGLPEQFASAELARLPTLLGHRLVLALDAVRDRIDAGDDLRPLEDLIRPTIQQVADHLYALHGAYERECDAKDERLRL